MEWIINLTYSDIDEEYNYPEGEWHPVTIEIQGQEKKIDLPFAPQTVELSVVLGKVVIDGSAIGPFGSGSITLTRVRKGDNYFEIDGYADVDVVIQDLFDFNYFNPNWLVQFFGFPKAASIFQCGFDQPGSVVDGSDKSGQVALIRINVENTALSNDPDTPILKFP